MHRVHRSPRASTFAEVAKHDALMFAENQARTQHRCPNRHRLIFGVVKATSYKCNVYIVFRGVVPIDAFVNPFYMYTAVYNTEGLCTGSK